MSDSQQDVWEAIGRIRIATLTTVEEQALVSRPMASLARPEDGLIYFITRLDGKVGEIGETAPVNLAYSDPHKNLYVSVSGTASTSQDREKLRDLWSAFSEAWLPEGPDGADVALISVDPEEAKIWDATSSNLLYAGKVLKAVLTQMVQAEAPRQASLSPLFANVATASSCPALSYPLVGPTRRMLAPSRVPSGKTGFLRCVC